MITHLFRLVWNRRRANGLMLVELFVSFLVLAAVASTVVHLGSRAMRPNGYDYEDVWVVTMGFGPFYDRPPEEQAAKRKRIALALREVEARPEVAAAALARNVPYVNGRSRSGWHWQGDVVYAIDASGTAGLAAVMGIEPVAGRWFTPDDRPGETSLPTVISRGLAEVYFGAEDPVGRLLPREDRDGNPETPTPDDPFYRVVGVVDDYRWLGEFGAPHHTYFHLIDTANNSWYPPYHMLVRVRPGTPLTFEEELVGVLRGVGPDWNVRLQPLAEIRRSMHREQLAGPVIGLVIAGFLVLTVGLGLVGVLWQNVTRRTSEMAVRRAMGASGDAVRGQILGEMLALATVAMVLGSLVFVQAPLLGILQDVAVGELALAIAAAAAFVYVLVTVCGLYPGWLATRIQPAQALQYE